MVSIFNERGIELLKFLLKRNQKKIRKIDQTIVELKEQLEAHKETADFVRLTT